MDAIVLDRDAAEASLAAELDCLRQKVSGWVAPSSADNAPDGLVVTLTIGSMLLGVVRRDRARPDADAALGYEGPPAGFQFDDFGLRAFARLAGLEEPAVLASMPDGSSVRLPLEFAETHALEAAPLGSRNGIRKSVRLADVWMESARTLALRFDGGGRTNKRLDVYQCTAGAPRGLVQLAGDCGLGSASTVSVRLLNPLLPLLMIFRGEDGAIDTIGFMPFPSLLRGGLHSAEPLLTGHGGDGLEGLAELSSTLLAGMFDRKDRPQFYVTSIELDAAVNGGFEPMLNDDVLAWLGSFLEIPVLAGTREGGEKLAEFIAERIAAHAPAQRRRGPSLTVPADAVPTISAIASWIPKCPVGRTLAGSFGVSEWNRNGRIWSVWLPAADHQLEALQPLGGRHFGPSLRLPARDGAQSWKQEAAPNFPLAIVIRPRPTQIGAAPPFEIASELPVPLLRNGTCPDTETVDAVIVFDRAGSSPLPLIQTLSRQESIGTLSLTVCRPSGENDAELKAALKALFPGRHKLLVQPRHSSRLEQLSAAIAKLSGDVLFIADGRTILHDVRTLATLLPLLALPDVATAGCLVRSGDSQASPVIAGYSLTGLDLLGTPSLAFDVIDPAIFRQPATYSVVANSTAALVAKRSVLAGLQGDPSGSLQPELDDLLLGLHSLHAGAINLCTTSVSVCSTAPRPRGRVRSFCVPYRLTPTALDRVARAATLVQRLQ